MPSDPGEQRFRTCEGSGQRTLDGGFCAMFHRGDPVPPCKGVWEGSDRAPSHVREMVTRPGESNEPLSVSECDRCGATEHVSVRTWCAECGPVPLCSQCDQWHREEMADG